MKWTAGHQRLPNREIVLCPEVSAIPRTGHYTTSPLYTTPDTTAPNALAHTDKAPKFSLSHQRASQLCDTLREELTAAKSSIR